MKAKKPKKLYLTEDEKSNIDSRGAELKTYQYHCHLINNDIVAYLKSVVYTRLSLDPNKDYPLSGNGEYLIVEEKEKNGTEPKNDATKPAAK
jgi:hypothetical protein